jgi:hypothetical protein
MPGGNRPKGGEVSRVVRGSSGGKPIPNPSPTDTQEDSSGHGDQKNDS